MTGRRGQSPGGPWQGVAVTISRMATATVEREIKLEWPSVADARAAVAALGAAPVAPRRLQDDVLLDTPELALRAERCALRVRRDGDVARLTFKGRPHADSMKVREELETGVGDADIVFTLLERLGFTPVFRYQKYREEFRLDGVTIAIDETPVGVFVELESPDGIAIDALAVRLGRGPADYVTDSYYGLFAARRAERGLAGPHMVFASA